MKLAQYVHQIIVLQYVHIIYLPHSFPDGVRSLESRRRQDGQLEISQRTRLFNLILALGVDRPFAPDAAEVLEFHETSTGSLAHGAL
jgi:hypothetical protein